jgi:hypothetical protein
MSPATNVYLKGDPWVLFWRGRQLLNCRVRRVRWPRYAGIRGVQKPVPTLSLKRLCSLLVECGLVYASAVEDSEGYDEGVKLGGIERLHRALAVGVPPSNDQSKGGA